MEDPEGYVLQSFQCEAGQGPGGAVGSNDAASNAAAKMIEVATHIADSDEGPASCAAQCEPAPGRMIALWGELDAQFFVVRIDALRDQVAGSSVANPTAKASHLCVPGVPETMVELSSMRWDEAKGDYVDDDQLNGDKTTYLHELMPCDSLVTGNSDAAAVQTPMD